MNERPDMQDWEDQINALLDGELNDAEAEALKAAAEHDQALARAIVEAYQLQRALSALPLEPAPANLRRSLRNIPREQKALDRPAIFGPRRGLAWGLGLAAVPLAVMLVVPRLGPQEPTPAEVAEARQDFAVAMAYLGKAGRMTEREIEDSIGDGMSRPVTEEAVRSLAEPFEFKKEHDA